jgi:hypothetical protein
VFEEVREAEGALPVLETADAHRDGAGALLRLPVVDEEQLDAVGELGGLVGALIVGRFLRDD